MSQRLCRHPDDLSALVAQTAAGRGLPVPYVEKDFWVTEVLRAAAVDREVGLPDGSTGSVTFIFKGGTSLSCSGSWTDSLKMSTYSPSSRLAPPPTRVTRSSRTSTLT